MHRLKELRKEKNMTQEQLANVIQVTKLTVSNWENNKHPIKSDKASVLADLFRVSIPYLLGLDDNTRLAKEASVESDPALERTNQVFKQSSFLNTSETLAHTGLQFLTDYLEEVHQLRLAYDYLIEENEQLKAMVATLKVENSHFGRRDDTVKSRDTGNS